MGVSTYRELLAGRASGRCKLAGIVIGKRELNSRKGNRMAFVQCSDAAGVFEVTLFSEVLGRSRDLLEMAEPILMNLSVEWPPEAEEPRLTANELGTAGTGRGPDSRRLEAVHEGYGAAGSHDAEPSGARRSGPRPGSLAARFGRGRRS